MRNPLHRLDRVRRVGLALAVVGASLVALASLPATAIPTPQVFATFGSPSAGALQGTSFTVAGCDAGAVGTSDLSGADFSPAGAATQATVSCTASSLAVTFDAPVDGLDLYLVDLPNAGRCIDGVYTVTTDGGSVSLGSGFATATLAGTTLTVPSPGPDSGVLHVAGPVTTVGITTASGTAAVTFTLGTAYVTPTTTTTAPPSTTTTAATAPGAGVAGADATAGAAVTPAFTC